MKWIVTKNSEGKFEAGQSNYFSPNQRRRAVWIGGCNIAAGKKADELNKAVEKAVEKAR